MHKRLNAVVTLLLGEDGWLAMCVYKLICGKVVGRVARRHAFVVGVVIIINITRFVTACGR